MLRLSLLVAVLWSCRPHVPPVSPIPTHHTAIADKASPRREDTCEDVQQQARAFSNFDVTLTNSQLTVEVRLPTESLPRIQEFDIACFGDESVNGVFHQPRVRLVDDSRWAVSSITVNLVDRFPNCIGAGQIEVCYADSCVKIDQSGE